MLKQPTFPAITTPPAKPYVAPPECHKGNRKILEMVTEGSGTLYAGGWNRNAEMYAGDTIIDLTGNKKDQPDIEAQDETARKDFLTTLNKYNTKEAASILHLYIPDFNIPNWDKSLWKPLAKDIVHILKSGRDVLVACAGGHGRTGVAISILAYLIDPALVGNSPITWLRKIYCKKVVESQKQIDYIYEVLELGESPKALKPAKTVTVSSPASSTGWGSASPGYSYKEGYFKNFPHQPITPGAYQNIGGKTVPVSGPLSDIPDEEWDSMMHDHFGS